MIHALIADFRQAARSLRAAPLVTAAAAVTLALGIGATTAIFSVANALILRPLPVRDPHQLVTITSDTALRFGFQGGAGWNYAMWDRLRQRADTFGGAFAWTMQRVDLSEGGEMQPVNALLASGDLFNTLGVSASLGRVFTPADDVRGGGPDGAVAVISHDLWQRRFNGAAEPVGSRLPMEGVPFTIVGVTPPDFKGVDVGQPFDVAIPFGAEPLIRGKRTLLDSDRAFLLTIMLRLKPQQTRSEAVAALRAIQPEILAALKNPPGFVEEPFTLVPASTGISALRQIYERPILTLAIVSGLVLTIVCMNVAHLLLARGAGRRRELSIRLALGARPWRVSRQLLVEGLLLGGAGAIVGLLVAAWGSRTLVALLPATAARVALDVAIDWRVLAFTAAITAIAVALFSAMPAVRAARVAPMEALQDDPRVAAEGRTYASGGLIVAQVAVSLVLVAAAGLFVRTLERLTRVPLGFEPKNMVVVTVDTSRVGTDPAAQQASYQRIVDAVASVAGVSSAAGSGWVPVGSGGGGLLTDARGRRAEGDRRVAYNFVTPGWFRTYGTPIREGREFDARDTAGAPRVAVINEALRRASAADQSAVGSTIEAGPCGRGGCTIVGVAADAVYGRSLRDEPPPTIYVPLAPAAGLAPLSPPLRVSFRAAADPARVVPAVASALRDVDRRLTFAFRPLESDIRESLAQERLVAILAASFGVVALLLSSVGLYGVTAYAVARRRSEIGIRLALGALPGGVIRLVLARIVLLVAAGTAIGIAISLWLSRFVAPLLYGLEPRDPLTLTFAAAALALVGILGGWLPASRAARLDPARVLREN